MSRRTLQNPGQPCEHSRLLAHAAPPDLRCPGVAEVVLEAIPWCAEHNQPIMDGSRPHLCYPAVHDTQPTSCYPFLHEAVFGVCRLEDPPKHWLEESIETLEGAVETPEDGLLQFRRKQEAGIGEGDG